MPQHDRSEQHLLHFDLPADDSEFTFHVAGREYRPARHTRPTREDARADNAFLRLLPDHAVSHYAEVPLPADAVALMWVTAADEVDGAPVERLVSMGIHVPREARLRDVRGNLHLLQAEELHPKLAYRQAGLQLLQNQRVSLEAIPDKLADIQDAYETGIALLFQHPELINLNKDAASGGPVTVIEECIRQALKSSNLLMELASHAKDWSSLVQALDDSGAPILDDVGKPVFLTKLHPAIAATLPAVAQKALVLSKQNAKLRGQAWSVEYGTTNADYGGDVRPKPKVAAAPEALRGASDVNWRLKNLTPSNGLEFEPAVRYTPGEGSTTWSADGVWSASDDRAVGPFDEIAQKALADGRLHLAFGRISGPVLPVSGTERSYTVRLSQTGLPPFIAQGELRLNAEGTALQYRVTTTQGAVDDAYFGIGITGSLQRVHSVAVRNIGNSGNLVVVAKNHWLRHLSAYVEFLDAAGRPQPPPNWSSRFPVSGTSFDSHATKRFVDLIGPVETMMGIPLPADSSHLSFPVPANAATVRITWGGLGQGRNDEVACPVGAIATVVIEQALPVVMLAAGAALTASGGLLKLVREKPIWGVVIAAFTGAYIANDPAKAIPTIAKKLIPVIAKGALGKLSEYLASKIIEGGAKKALPFINIALFLADTAATMAQLAQTNSAIRQSPRAHLTEITRSIDLRITITSSKVYKKFPDHHHHLAVVVAYDSGATLPKLVRELPQTTISEDIVVDFHNVPAAGNLRVLVFFYAENDWQSGQGASAWMKAEGSGGSATLVVPAIEIGINEVPLGRWSVYEHMQKLVLKDGVRSWKHAAPPDAVKTTPSQLHGSILQRHSISMAQYSEYLGYCWQAEDLDLPPDDISKPPSANKLYAVQNISVLEQPQRGHALSRIGFTAGSGIAYDLTSPDDGSGRNFFIDPTRGVFDENNNPAGGFHLRRVSLNFKLTPEFNVRREESYGRFPDAIDGMVVHPHGYVFAIRRGRHKIYRVALPDSPGPDADAPMATLASGEGDRDGLIKSPLAIALALDGRLLVLEEGNGQRVQAFDVNGNPVAYFKHPTTKAATPILTLRTDSPLSLLDMAVEAKGHIFILGHTGSGKQPSDYRLDLYDPSGAYLTSTSNFTAARITVDLLRNVFAMNYEVLDSKGRRPEPGISQWRPPAPPKSTSESGESA